MVIFQCLSYVSYTLVDFKRSDYYLSFFKKKNFPISLTLIKLLGITVCYLSGKYLYVSDIFYFIILKTISMDDYYCLLLNGESTLNNGKYIFRDLKTLLF